MKEEGRKVGVEGKEKGRLKHGEGGRRTRRRGK